MLSPGSELESAIKDTDKLVDLVMEEYISLNVNPQADYVKGTAYIGFRIGRDYFKGAMRALDDSLLLSGTGLVRSAVENFGDLSYIFLAQGKKETYAKAYVGSISKFTGAMLLSKLKGMDATLEERLLKQSNNWTGATIEQRLKAAGKSYLTIYDMMSYFSHPNPAAISYLDKERLLAAQLSLVKDCNCMTMLGLMGIIINHSDLKSISHSTINELTTKLGFPLIKS